VEVKSLMTEGCHQRIHILNNELLNVSLYKVHSAIIVIVFKIYNILVDPLFKYAQKKVGFNLKNKQNHKLNEIKKESLDILL
jgi:hypothetical protein